MTLLPALGASICFCVCRCCSRGFARFSYWIDTLVLTEGNTYVYCATSPLLFGEIPTQLTSSRGLSIPLNSLLARIKSCIGRQINCEKKIKNCSKDILGCYIYDKSRPVFSLEASLSNTQHAMGEQITVRQLIENHIVMTIFKAMLMYIGITSKTGR